MVLILTQPAHFSAPLDGAIVWSSVATAVSASQKTMWPPPEFFIFYQFFFYFYFLAVGKLLTIVFCLSITGILGKLGITVGPTLPVRLPSCFVMSPSLTPQTGTVNLATPPDKL